MHPPVTGSPALTSTGTGSPVSIDASTADAPDSTTPSTAIFSPGRTTNRSPTARLAAATRTSRPSRSSIASLAPSEASARSAAPERRLARASKYRPSRISTVTPAAASRYSADPSICPASRVNGIRMPGSPAVPKNSAYSDQVNDAVTPIETRVSIVAAPCRALITAARWKGHAPHTATGAARASDSHCQFRNCQAGTIPRTTTGTASSSEISSRWRSAAAWSPAAPVLAPGGRPGRRPVPGAAPRPPRCNRSAPPRRSGHRS